LLEALDSVDVSEEGVVDLRSLEGKEYSQNDLIELLKKHCGDLLPLIEESDQKTQEWIEEWKTRVEKNPSLTSDERTAWLGNIKMMRGYYRQYMQNETVYHCILERIADVMVKRHIHEIDFKLYQNFGLVFSHLIPVLTDHRPPVDAQITVQEDNEGAYGRLKTYSRPKA
jgi:hypothetical protein